MKSYVPQIIQFKSQHDLDKFVHTKNPFILDNLELMLKEEYFVYKPDYYFRTDLEQKNLWKNHIEEHASYKKQKECWLYHPWSNKLMHILKREDFIKLRTVRHLNLITTEEQLRLYNKKIAIAGLSVGSNVLLSFIRYGIGNIYNIADMDSVALTNINRAQYSLEDLGKQKAIIMRDKINTIDPFIQTNLFDEGLSLDVLDDFLNNADLVIDAFDQFNLKIQLRKRAKALKIPVVSGFDIEKGVIIIIERFDTEDLGLEVFLNNYSEEQLYSQKTIEDKTNMFVNIIGREHHSKKMLDSVLSVGKELTGYPQLIIATSLAASVFTTAAEDILLGKNLKSKRVHISLSDLIL